MSTGSWADGPEHALAAAMTRKQLSGRDIHDQRVLSIMSRLPRDLFVPGKPAAEVYADHPVAIGHGQTISQPYMVAVMTQELRLRGTERVLEIGTGSGYQTAVLSALAAAVYTVEIIEVLQTRARGVLASLGLTNIRYHTGDGSLGWVDHAPFDRILLTAAPRSLPEPLKLQLAEGGILVAPVGEHEDYQQLVILERSGGTWTTRLGIGCRFVPLVTAAP